jgi:Uma2 family endonuclease
MSLIPHHQYTYEEYLRLEEMSPYKLEYYEGEIYAMTGGTPQHAGIAAAFIGFFAAHLMGKPCRVYASDLRILVQATGLATHPDLSVVCGPLEHDPIDPNAVTNPNVVVEVLGKSTEKYDRNVKREHYQTIPSLRDYILVAQRERKIEHWRRSETGWSLVNALPGEALQLAAFDCTLDVAELYRQALD